MCKAKSNLENAVVVYPKGFRDFADTPLSTHAHLWALPPAGNSIPLRFSINDHCVFGVIVKAYFVSLSRV